MIVKAHQKGSLCYAQIDGMYSDEELQNIQKELVFLETIKQPPQMTATAEQNGKPLKNGNGIFLDVVYANRDCSSLLRASRKIFEPSVIDQLKQSSCFYEHLKRSTRDSTLINFYGESGGYETHHDSSIFTAVTFFQIGKFSGGRFMFADYDVIIDPMVGRTIIFPGCVLHKAEAVIANPGNYRVTMAQFINYG